MGTQLVKTPNEWLAESLEGRRFPQRTLARSLGVDTSRFNRWVHGEEQIPRAYLVELAQHFPSSDIKYLLSLKDCEDFSDQLTRRAMALSETLGLGGYPAQAIFRQIEDLVAQEHPLDSLGRADAFLRHLVDATGAVMSVHRTVEVNYQEPLLLPPTVARFRYPINHFVGTLLDLDEHIPAGAREARAVQDFRERLLGSLRPLANANPRRERWQEVARQFSVHILARHGDSADRELVQELLGANVPPLDPLLRRISFTGVILGGANDHTIEAFRLALQRDGPLRTANLFFNAFHYGDATFAADGSLPRMTKSFRKSVPHVLRHLERPDRYGKIETIEASTLLHMLEVAGPKPFQSRPILARLNALLDSDSFLVQEASVVRQAFRQAFGRLLKSVS